MKTLPLILLASAAIAHAAPPAKPQPRPAANRPQPTVFTTTPYGNGVRTTDGSGRTWTTTPYGNGTRTTGPGGSSYQTSRYGNGTLTRGTGAPPPVTPALPRK